MLVSGSSCRLACFRHRWSSVRTVTKTGPELLSRWISRCAHVEKSSPWWISSSSSPLKILPCIPRTNPPPLLHSTLCSFLFLSLTSVSPRSFPSPFLQHPHRVILIFFKCHHQRYGLCITGWFTTLVCFYGILSEKRLQLWVFMCVYTWIRLRKRQPVVVTVKFPLNQSCTLAGWLGSLSGSCGATGLIPTGVEASPSM